jgi:hypothetical protein
MKKLIIAGLVVITFSYHSIAGFDLKSNANLNVVIAPGESQVVHTALQIFSDDYRKVFGGNILNSKDGRVFIGTVGNKSYAETIIDKKYIKGLKDHKEGYAIQVKDDKLYILGSDKHGTAFGILELSRMIGVSPWEWWADSYIEKKESLTLQNGFNRMEYPSVAHRGIFLNDEDWGINPWSYLTNEPSPVKGQIGPKTHARIFELLLRLRANTFWPAMHSCSVPFYFTPGNKEIADKYGIFIGTSHCEPMMRNANGEWKPAGTGEYDFVHNKDNVLKFWEERVKQLAGSDNIYTLGIRGVHDGKMQGANTLQEQKDALKDVLRDERAMLAKYINPDLTKVPQVFIPYKEVLDVYNMGLKVPDDVTLIWCDDNYGYIRHFPNNEERARKGGNGVYYHISYWGRPHDYLWLATNHPAQVYTQMKLAYDKGAKDMWILNVGDIKPGEYLTELFLDMAWNINAIQNNAEGLDKHLHAWLSREFGKENAKDLLDIMNEYYRLAYIRKPEFMANTREEEKDKKYQVVSDLPWSEIEIKERINDYNKIAAKAIQISKRIPANKQDAWFELIEYPVRGAAEMNKKHLYGQLARHNKADWTLSDAAFDSIVSLTDKYNSLANGKWNNMMTYQPRKLEVFKKVPHIQVESALAGYKTPLFLLNGNEYKRFVGDKPVSHGLGYQRGAISLQKSSTVAYDFESTGNDSIRVEITLAPNHPVEGKEISYGISIDNEPVKTVGYRTDDRNEEWKQNVLTNQSSKVTTHRLRSAKAGTKHTLNIKALNEGVVIDQVKIWSK